MESIHTCHSEPARTLAWESPNKKGSLRQSMAASQ